MMQLKKNWKNNGECSMYNKKVISIFRENIDSIVKTNDAILVYLKSGKCWVCEEVVINDKNLIKLTLKGKCEK